MKNLIVAALVAVPAAVVANETYVEVPVSHVEPIKQVIEIVEPTRRCWFEDVPERPQGESRSHTVPLVGAIVGAAVGNEVGHNKTNKRIGAAAGALLGASIASDIQRQRQQRVADSSVQPVVRQEVCTTDHHRRSEERITGYMVTYSFGGETYRVRVAEHPGESIRLRVRHSPA